MRFFVLIYSQSQGRLFDIESYGPESGQAALARRISLDNAYAGQPDVEVVLLSAESEAALRRTHSRYFESLAELAKGA
jgi:hypothetical protein